jgi:hypothetical protein
MYFCMLYRLMSPFGVVTPVLYRGGSLAYRFCTGCILFFVNILMAHLTDIYIYIYMDIHFGIFVMFTCV